MTQNYFFGGPSVQLMFQRIDGLEKKNLKTVDNAEKNRFEFLVNIHSSHYSTDLCFKKAREKKLLPKRVYCNFSKEFGT
jgi:hypothetical protein